MAVFKDRFVPWERVFLCGECEYLQVRWCAKSATSAGIRTAAASADVGDMLKKYLKGKNDVPTEDRARIGRLVEKLALESRDIVSNIHGACSPQTHRMTVLRGADIEAKKKYAQDIAGIACDDNKADS